MTEFSNEPIVPGSGPEMSLVDTWIAAFTKPQETTYARIVSQPSANATKAFLWVFLASLLTSLVSAVAGLGTQMNALRQFLPPEIVSQLPATTAPVGIGTVICGAPIGAIFAVIFFAISTGLVQWVAKLFGGVGTFDKLAYAFSAIFVPYSVITAVLALFSIIPYVGFLTGLIDFALWIYTIILAVLAVKAVDRLETGRAVGAVLLPWLAILLLICCCIAIGASALVPIISQTYQGIQ